MDGDNNKNTEWTDEEKQNVVGVFQILLDVDKRTNPHLYKKKKQTKKPPSLKYKFSNSPDNLGDAFDILFKEVEKNNGTQEALEI